MTVNDTTTQINRVNPPPPASPGPVRALRRRRSAVATFLTLGSPGFILYAFAVLVPLALAIIYSFQDYNLLSSTGRFIGLSNYAELFQDSDFWTAYGFTGALTLFLLIVSNVMGVALAVTLNKPVRGFHLLRTIVFIPVLLSGVIVAFLWSTILTDSGILNSLLQNLHLTGLENSWLGSRRGAQLSVMIVSAWPAIGFSTIIYLAALQGVPQDLLEAADVDGAGPTRRFFSVVRPLLMPALVVNSTIMLINGSKSYEVSLILTGGGPVGATETGALQVLQTGFTQNRAGYASAIAVVILATVALLSVAGSALASRADR